MSLAKRNMCAGPSCTRKRKSDGELCTVHSNQQWRGEALRPLLSGERDGGTCAGPGCSLAAQSRGLCDTHYNQVWSGRPLAVFQPRVRYGPVCSFPDCGRKHASRGLCIGHYGQRAKGLDLTPLRGQTTRGVLAYWVADLLGQKPTGECVDWPFGKSGERPSHVILDGRRRALPHYLLEQTEGPRPSSEHWALHSCDRGICVAPWHLRWGTQVENVSDAMERGRMVQQKHARLVAWLDERGIEFPADTR